MFDSSNKRKAFSWPPEKTTYQFQVHEGDHSPFSKLDQDYSNLFKVGSGDNFQISRKHLNLLQEAASYTMDACCHQDILFSAIKACITVSQSKIAEFYDLENEEQYNEFHELTSELQEVLDYVQSLTFSEEFIVKKSVYIFSHITAFMRESMLAQCRGLEPEYAHYLKTLPFNSGALYNDSVRRVISNRGELNRDKAFADWAAQQQASDKKKKQVTRG